MSVVSNPGGRSTYIGKDGTGDDDSCVSIIDLSLVPTEITHLVTAVISRIVFESLQRYRRLYNKSLPTVLVAEEAGDAANLLI